MAIPSNSFPAFMAGPLLDMPSSAHVQDQASILEEIQVVTHLLRLGQVFCEQMQSGLSLLCNEVRRVTGDRAYLCLDRRRMIKKSDLPVSAVLIQPVQFGNQVYGVLCIAADPLHKELPALSLPVVHLLTQVCGWLLYTIEQSSFLQGQCQQLDYQINGPLSKREREVLTLMCRGYNQEMIADLLSISPATDGKHRQHIYEQLGVHSEHDALLVAYQTGLFSLIEERPV